MKSFLVSIIVGGFILVTNIWADPNVSATIDKPMVGSVKGGLLQPKQSAENDDRLIQPDRKPLEPSMIELVGRLQLLEFKNRTMKDRMGKLYDKIDLMEKNIAELQEKQKQAGECFVNKMYTQVDQIRDRLGPRLFVLMVGSIIAALLFLLIYLIVPSRKKTINVNYPQGCLASEKENDESTEDGIADDVGSKLNLARAYIEMGDKDKAKPLLLDILHHGSDDDQKEAKLLLNEMSHGENSFRH